MSAITEMASVAFGPVPSRRLGRSIGINNIPAKICSYSCVYCQVGRTRRLRFDRQLFIDPNTIERDVRLKVDWTRDAGGRIDYLSFVPDGEPTLDARLGEAIDALRPLGIPVAVITNGSLLWQEDVRRDLQKVDWVSLKVDSVSERTWRRMNRPHRSLRREAILEGMLAFRERFRGCLVTETMLVAGHNDDEENANATASFLARLKPATAYLSVPTRPPAEKSVTPPAEAVVQTTRQIFLGRMPNVELLVACEGDSFSCSGEPEEALLGITAVHPMRREAVKEFLRRSGQSWSLVQGLLEEGQLVETEYGGETYYRRALPNDE
jgi:wyosine [tRNA(Phe)-imidazoG37] synthetase (radical SAM superfamily)